MAARRRSTTRKTTTRKTTTRGTAARKATTARPKPAPTPPAVGPGERLFVLSVPFEERGVATANGATWDPYTRQTIYIGPALPYGLTPYAAPDYSWERWVEDDLNGTRLPTQPSPVTMTPRPHQVTAIDKIEATALRGYRGFVEADDVGLGKTVASWVGALRVAKHRGAQNVLVMCPKGVIPHWRRTIAAVGDDGLRVVVINYDQAKKLLAVPDSAAAAKRTRTKNKHTATKGTPLVQWDVVLFDESHKLKNSTSQRSQAAARIARYAEAAARAPYVIWMSATAGQDPTELAYLAPLLSQITGAPKSSLKDFGQWLADEGFAVTYNARFDKWDWGTLPADADPATVAAMEAAKTHDLERIRALLFDGPDAPSIRRLPTDIAGWPEIQRILLPVDLDPTQRHLYEQAWTAFRSEMNLARKGRDPIGGMAARLRFRQKASLIRVPGTVEQILDLLDNGHQVAVSVEFQETLAAIRDELAKSRIAVAEFHGQNTATREAERLRFQRGERKVILFSVAEGISLHQGEALGDGTTANNAPRTTIVHDPRYSGLVGIQIEGRCHRDGQNANVFYAYAADTVEEKMVRTLVGRVLTTKQMAGDDVTAIRALEATLDAAIEDPAPFTATPPNAPPATPPTAPPAAPPPAAPRPASTTKPPAATRPPARPGTPGPMTPEERAFRAAMAGGKARQVTKRPATAEERDALRRGMQSR